MKYLLMVLIFTTFLFPDDSRRLRAGSRVDQIDVSLMIDGKNLDVEPDELVISVTHDQAKGSQAEVRFRSKNSGGSNPEPAFIGSRIEILAGYSQSYVSLFSGRVRAVNISSGGSDQLASMLKCRRPGSGKKSMAKTGKPLFELIYGSNVDALDLTYTRQGVIKGSLLIQGTGDIKPGHRLSLKGFPSGFNRKVTVIGTKHTLSPDSWTTRLTVKQIKAASLEAGPEL